MRRKEPKHCYVTVYECFPIFKWQKCSYCGEEVKLEKIYKVTFHNDKYFVYQKPFFICKKCALKQIIGDSVCVPILERAIPKYLAEYYENTEAFRRFKEASNRIL